MHVGSWWQVALKHQLLFHHIPSLSRISSKWPIPPDSFGLKPPISHLIRSKFDSRTWFFRGNFRGTCWCLTILRVSWSDFTGVWLFFSRGFLELFPFIFGLWNHQAQDEASLRSSIQEVGPMKDFRFADYQIVFFFNSFFSAIFIG